MTETKWFHRLILMETVGSLPGVVGSIARHLRSVALLEQDHGAWE